METKCVIRKLRNAATVRIASRKNIVVVRVDTAPTIIHSCGAIACIVAIEARLHTTETIWILSATLKKEERDPRMITILLLPYHPLLLFRETAKTPPV